MAYRVEISPTAYADIDSLFLYIRDYAESSAETWLSGCFEAMLSLETSPERCALAVESEYMGIEVRQLLYAKRFRILFTIAKGDRPDTGVVQIHRVRRGAQQRLRTISQLDDPEE